MLALVTGVASGFGLRFTRMLLASGVSVVGVDRVPVPDWPADIRDHAGLFAIHGDLTKHEVVASVTQACADRGGIALLVNNAGYGMFNTVEEADFRAVEQLFAANVFAPGRLLQAVLPQLRQHGGAVVQLSSVAGRMVFPESGWYAATKYALEALSEALAVETAEDGVRVRVVEPGRFDTRFGEVAGLMSRPRPTDSPYAERYPHWDRVKDGMLAPPQDPDLVARLALASLDDPRPFLRLPAGTDAVAILEERDRAGEPGWIASMIERFSS